MDFILYTYIQVNLMSLCACVRVFLPFFFGSLIALFDAANIST